MPFRPLSGATRHLADTSAGDMAVTPVNTVSNHIVNSFRPIRTLSDRSANFCNAIRKSSRPVANFCSAVGNVSNRSADFCNVIRNSSGSTVHFCNAIRKGFKPAVNISNGIRNIIGVRSMMCRISRPQNSICCVRSVAPRKCKQDQADAREGVCIRFPVWLSLYNTICLILICWSDGR